MQFRSPSHGSSRTMRPNRSPRHETAGTNKETPPRGGRRPNDAIAGVVVQLCYFNLHDVKRFREGLEPSL